MFSWFIADMIVRVLNLSYFHLCINQIFISHRKPQSLSSCKCLFIYLFSYKLLMYLISAV